MVQVDEGIANTKKYAKWKCMQINKCLKDGTRYIPSTDQKAQQEDDDGILLFALLDRFVLELLRELTAFGTPTLVPPPAKDINSFEHDYKEEKPQVPHHSNADAGYGFNGKFYIYGLSVFQPHDNLQFHHLHLRINTVIYFFILYTLNFQFRLPWLKLLNLSAHLPAHIRLLQVIELLVIQHLNFPGGVKQPTMEEFVEARKYIKYALSAVDFEDTKAVIDNLHKALRLMQS